MLGRELLNKKDAAIRIALGETISHNEIQHLCDQQLVNYLRLNTTFYSPLLRAIRRPMINLCHPLQSACP